MNSSEDEIIKSSLERATNGIYADTLIPEKYHRGNYCWFFWLLASHKQTSRRDKMPKKKQSNSITIPHVSRCYCWLCSANLLFTYRSVFDEMGQFFTEDEIQRMIEQVKPPSHFMSCKAPWLLTSLFTRQPFSKALYKMSGAFAVFIIATHQSWSAVPTEARYRFEQFSSAQHRFCRCKCRWNT